MSNSQDGKLSGKNKLSENDNDPIDRCTSISEDWYKQSERRSLKYFIPDWDDVVDPDYDFENESYSRGSGGWENEVFAHQIYDTPNYDGILVSREVIQKSKKKQRKIKSYQGRGGIHRYLRVPRRFPVMGDCGAFGYIKQEKPPYKVENVVEYYTRNEFDLGISVDHLVIGADTQKKRQYRYDLTLDNALSFLESHRERGLSWTPMAAVQGWDTHSYVEAACKCVEMGYDYLAIGGLVRSQTEEVVHLLESIREAVGGDIRLHALGIARFSAIPDFLRLGIASMDSSTYLRRAWLSARDNYWTKSHKVFTAIRVPGPTRALRSRAKKEAKRAAGEKYDVQIAQDDSGALKEEKEAWLESKKEELIEQTLDSDLSYAHELEQACFEALRAFAEGAKEAPSIQDVLQVLETYYAFIERDVRLEDYWAMLKARPWETCGCVICEASGVEVAIFRGNNRNRRRGFHNTHVFYNLLGEMIDQGDKIDITRGSDVYEMPDSERKAGSGQLQLDLVEE